MAEQLNQLQASIGTHQMRIDNIVFFVHSSDGQAGSSRTGAPSAISTGALKPSGDVWLILVSY